MVYHVSPWLEMVRAFNQLILGACLVIDIASVSLAQEYLVRGAGVKMSSSYPSLWPLAWKRLVRQSFLSNKRERVRDKPLERLHRRLPFVFFG